MKLLGCLLALFLVSGCFDKPQPPPNPGTPQTTAQRIDGVLKDTADDLELGAKVRTIVYNQDQKRLGTRSRNHYDLPSILIGAVFLVVLVTLHHCWVCGGKDAK